MRRASATALAVLPDAVSACDNDCGGVHALLGDMFFPETAQAEERAVGVEFAYRQPFAIVEVDMPLMDIAQSERRLIMLDLVAPVAVGVVGFPCHGHCVQPVYLGREQSGCLFAVDESADVVDRREFQIRRFAASVAADSSERKHR